MKAELDENGVLLVTPETPTEAYALKQWGISSWVLMQDVQRNESGHWRGSSLMVDVIFNKCGKEQQWNN